MKRIGLLFFCLFGLLSINAQAPLVQIIQSAPGDTAVDLYVNGNLYIDDFYYQDATTFLTATSGVQTTLAYAPANSTSVNDAFATFPLSFEDGKIYALTSIGLVGNPDTPFDLHVDEEALIASPDTETVAVHFLNASPGIPQMDLCIRLGDKLVAEVDYGSGDGYVEIAPEVYYFDFKDSSGTIVGTYQVNLQAVAGGAFRYIASGFENGQPELELFIAQTNGTEAIFQHTPVARIQILHNAPYEPMDMYVNGNLVFNDFAYRAAIPYVFTAADIPVEFGFAPETSLSADDTIASVNYQFENGGTYCLTTAGTLTDPVFPLQLILDENAIERWSDTSKTAVMLHHGTPDALALDFETVGQGVSVDGIGYPQYTSHFELEAMPWQAYISPDAGGAAHGLYNLDLSDYKGVPIRLFTSGFEVIADGIELYGLLPDGEVIYFPKEILPTARLQFIQNTPPAMDLYINGELYVDSFTYRTATPYMDFPGDSLISIGIAAANSNSVNDTVYNLDVYLEDGEVYSIMASGIYGNMDTPLQFYVEEGQEEAAPGFISMNLFQGSPVSPPLDFGIRLFGNVSNDMEHGESTGYLSLPANNYYLDVYFSGNDTIAATYFMQIANYNGQGMRIFTSGDVGGTPAFGVFAALPDGTVIQFPFAPVARIQILQNSPYQPLDFYVNGNLVLNDFGFLSAIPYSFAGANPLEFAVAPAGSQSVNDAFYTETFIMENGGSYLMIANGVPGSPDLPFKLQFFDEAREGPENPSQLELGFFNGSLSTPELDFVDFYGIQSPATDLGFGAFTGYQEFPPAPHYWDILDDENDNEFHGTWGANLSQDAGLTGVCFTSMNPAGNPSIELFLLLPDGQVLSFPAFSRYQLVHNSPDSEVDIYYNDVRLADDIGFREATPIGLLPSDIDFSLAVAPSNSFSINDSLYAQNFGALETGKTYLIQASGVVGDVNTPFEFAYTDEGRYRAYGGIGVDLIFFNGAPDVPLGRFVFTKFRSAGFR